MPRLPCRRGPHNSFRRCRPDLPIFLSNYNAIQEKLEVPQFDDGFYFAEAEKLHSVVSSKAIVGYGCTKVP